MVEKISSKNFYQMIRQHLLKIVGMALLGAVVALLIATMVIQPKYRSESKLLVVQSNNTQQIIQYNEVRNNVQLINTYRDIITSHQLLLEVSEQLNHGDTPEELRKAISVTQSPNSQVFSVRVTMADAVKAQEILTEIINRFEMTLKDVYGSFNPNFHVLQPATLPTKPVAPNQQRMMLIGAGIATILTIIYIDFKYVTYQS